MDEALGKKVEPVPFRAAPSTSTTAVAKTRRRSTGKLVLIIAVFVAAAIGLNQAGLLKAPGSTGATTRTSASRDYPSPGAGEKRTRLLPAPSAPTEAEGPRYRFLSHQHGTKTPVTWDPCRPIRYVVRPDNAPPGGEQMVQNAFATLSAATGLQFDDAGQTDEGPSEDRASYQPKKYGNRWAPVLVAWATETEVPDFGVEFAGEAGPRAVQTADGSATYVTGTVMLSAKDFQQFSSTGQSPVALGVVLHELGHLAGLAHVPDKGEIMYPRSGSATTYSSGDLAGLAALGRGPCHPDV